MIRDRLVPFALIVCLSAPALVGCSSSGPKQAAAQEFSSDAPGDQPVDGKVRIADVDRSSLAVDGTVRYVLDNVSGEDLKNLTARVTFYYPPGAEADIALPYTTDVTEEKSLVLFKGQRGVEFTAQSREFAARNEAGEHVLATRIFVLVEDLVPIVARDDASPTGTLLLNGQLECVGIADEDARSGRDGSASQLWLEFENVAMRPVSNVELRVVFYEPGDGGEGAGVRMAETNLVKLPDLAPAQRARVDFDLSGIDRGKLRSWRFLVRAVQSSGLGF